VQAVERADQILPGHSTTRSLAVHSITPILAATITVDRQRRADSARRVGTRPLNSASNRARSRNRRPALALALVAAGAAALGVTAQASAQAQQPTLQFDRPCYTEKQIMGLTGAGYTAGGPVDLIFARSGEPRGGYATHADAAGALSDEVMVERSDQLLGEGERRETILVAANDRTRIDTDQQPPESQFGFTQFTFTRWEGYSPGRYVPGKRAAVEIYGWAFAAGEPAWFLFRKGSRTVASVKVGRLDTECGDRRARIRVPRGLRPGAYRVVLTTDRRLRERYTWRKARVIASRAVAAAASNRPQAMSRATPEA
jgi:hypothetical protein